MTPEEFTNLKSRLEGQTIHLVHPGGTTTIGISLTNRDFFTLSADNFDLVIGPKDPLS